MSNRMKKKSGAMKYIVLLILLAILVFAYYFSNGDTQNPSNQQSNNPSNSSSSNINNNNNPSNNPNTPPINNNNDDEHNGTISGGVDIINVDGHTLYDTYVIASENTKYAEAGYKYFIVKSYSEYEKYISNNLKSPFDSSYISNYTNVNEQTIANLQNTIDKEYFKNNCLVFVVDYSSKEVCAKITNIHISDDTLTLNIDRTIDSINKSKFTTYIVPLNSTSIKSVSISYIK